MSQTSLESPQRALIASHEGLRGVAALLIALFHIPGHGGFATGLANFAPIGNAWIAVDLFFALSGFVLFWNYGHRIGNREDADRFMWRRLGRLYPLHLLSLAFFIVVWFGLQSMKWLASASGIELGGAPAFSGPEVNGLDFVLNLVLLQGVGIQGFSDAFNYPAWSVSVEMWMYLVFVTVIGMCTTQVMRARVFGLIAIVCLAWYLAQASAVPDFAQFFIGERNLFRGLLSFSVGAWVAWYRLRQVQSPSNLSALQLGVILASVLYLITLDNLGVGLLTGPVLFAVLIYLLSFDQGLACRVLVTRPLLWLGKHSYSIYMLHATLLMAFGAVARPLPSAIEPLFVLIYLVMLLLLARWSYRVIEAPWRTRVIQMAQRRERAKGTQVPTSSTA